MSLPRRASIYDQLRPHLNAKDLIDRLGLKLQRELGSEAYCVPLCHDSASGESLQINVHSGRWNCKACQSAGMHGDLIQLVEYVLTEGAAPSHGSQQGGSDSHRRAISWLCEQYGVAFNTDRVSGDPGLDVIHMVCMRAHRELLERPDMLAWVEEQWGFDLATVQSYGLGYLPAPIPADLAAESERHAAAGAFRSSGLGWYDRTGAWCTRFSGRILFPYLEHGRSLYVIGRRTAWTPPLADGREAPKYYKLPVHSQDRPHISEHITNDHLYNEAVMRTSDVVVIAEGIADAVALSALGVPVVSPVTISFNAVDLERFCRTAHEYGVRRVEVLFDNELSGSGNYAARRVASQLVENGLPTKILTLPLGPEQEQARDEVRQVLGAELFDDLERADPRARKTMIAEMVPDLDQQEWVKRNINASKIDGAEWVREQGPGAPGRFDNIRRAGVDVIDLEIRDLAKHLNAEMDASERAAHFGPVVALVAWIEDSLVRGEYAGKIAKAAGRGVTKVEISSRIATVRKQIVKPKRQEEKAKREEEDRPSREDAERALVLPPPEMGAPAPLAPVPPMATPGAPAAPAPRAAPGGEVKNAHERYATTRDNVADGVIAKVPEESLGEYVAQVITVSMGFTPFRTAEEIVLVRGGERIVVDTRSGAQGFPDLLWLASGFTQVKASHRAYIAAVIYFLGRGARETEDVSWSFVGRGGAVYFPTGDHEGQMLKVEPGKVTRTSMKEARVPAVSSKDFMAFAYTEERDGIDLATEAFRWTSIAPGDRLILLYWLTCLPILRRVGTVPIIRIEGGSGSGKTRAIDAVAWLVNGKKSSSVPTAAALVSRMSMEMLTIDDNRETGDVSSDMLGTLLQATHLGAREKRTTGTDTGTVIERICGALLMNGIEPIHNGRSELASRIVTLHCSQDYRVHDSPTAEAPLKDAILACRSGFWSEATRRCAAALDLDATHGEALGDQIEVLFGSTKIGRLSAYLRLMYQAWAAGLPEERRAAALETIAPEWSDAFAPVAAGALQSLLAEELAVSVLRYVFDFGSELAVGSGSQDWDHVAWGGKYAINRVDGVAQLGPVRSTQLARLARAAGKHFNAPPAIATSLRAGQLESRLLDGQAFIKAAGFKMEMEKTNKGRYRFCFELDPRAPDAPELTEQAPVENGTTADTWQAP